MAWVETYLKGGIKMSPIPRHKIGDEIDITCPICDGEGNIIIAPEQEGIPITCTECNGTGKIKGKVIKQ